MFGTKDSWRKQFGTDRTVLPSLLEHNLRVNGGMVELDAARQAGLAKILIERTGQKDLLALWKVVSGGATRVAVDARGVPERLAVVGAGILGPRELGLLQRHLLPAADGTVGVEEWMTAFGTSGAGTKRSAQDEAEPVAGKPTSHIIAREELPHLRADNDMPGVPMPSGAAPAGEPVAVSANWPGGYKEEDVVADVEARLIDAANSEWRQTPRVAPYSMLPEKEAKEEEYNPLPGRSAKPLLSPTYAMTTENPPYATRYGDASERLTARGSPNALRQQGMATPYGTTFNMAGQASRLGHEVTTPYASGGLWDISDN